MILKSASYADIICILRNKGDSFENVYHTENTWLSCKSSKYRRTALRNLMQRISKILKYSGAYEMILNIHDKESVKIAFNWIFYKNKPVKNINILDLKALFELRVPTIKEFDRVAEYVTNDNVMGKDIMYTLKNKLKIETLDAILLFNLCKLASIAFCLPGFDGIMQAVEFRDYSVALKNIKEFIYVNWQNCMDFLVENKKTTNFEEILLYTEAVAEIMHICIAYELDKEFTIESGTRINWKLVYTLQEAMSKWAMWRKEKWIQRLYRLSKVDLDKENQLIVQSCVYVIFNVKTKKVYVGSTTRNIKTRYREHYHGAKNFKSGGAYSYIRMIGFHNWIMIPVEKVDTIACSTLKGKAKLFRKWMEMRKLLRV